MIVMIFLQRAYSSDVSLARLYLASLRHTTKRPCHVVTSWTSLMGQRDYCGKLLIFYDFRSFPS